MNILYLCPNFPPNYRRFPVALKERGATVAGIGWEPIDQLRPEVRHALSEYCCVPDMGNYDHVLRAAGYLVSRVGKLDRVFSQEEHWIDLEAALRLDFNVPGWKPRDILPVRFKSLMKGVFSRAGIPVAQGEPASDLAGARRFAKDAGYPLIAKPDKGVGAHATFRIEDDKGLEGFFAKKDPAAAYFLEGFMEGVIQSFDGLTDPEGRIVFFTSHQFGIDIMTAVNENRHLHYWSLRKIPPDLEDFGRKAVAAFGLRERFFHIEFFRSPRGELRALEINARPPGGLTTDMFNYANDIDIYQEWARTVTGGRFEARAERPYHVSYIGRKNTRRYAHSHEEVLRRHGSLIMMHTPIDSVFRGAIGDYAYLARAADMDALWPVVEFIQKEA